MIHVFSSHIFHSLLDLFIFFFLFYLIILHDFCIVLFFFQNFYVTEINNIIVVIDNMTTMTFRFLYLVSYYHLYYLLIVSLRIQ